MLAVLLFSPRGSPGGGPAAKFLTCLQAVCWQGRIVVLSGAQYSFEVVYA